MYHVLGKRVMDVKSGINDLEIISCSINLDVMVYLDGVHGDVSATYLVGNVDEQGRKLVEAAKACLDYGVMVCGPGVPFQRIGKTSDFISH